MEASGEALVTGAGRGLGRAIALELASAGFDVTATVRDPAAGRSLLEESKDGAGSLKVQQLDLTDLGSYEPPAQLKLIVNNAAYRGAYLPVEETPGDEWRKTFETNLFGIAELVRRSIPALRATKGTICNISSVAIFFPMPFYSVYRASKAALGVLSETLYLELRPLGIRVIDIPAGSMDTDMMATSIAVRPAEAIDFPVYHDMASQQFHNRPTFPVISPAEQAQGIVKAILDDHSNLRHGANDVDAGLLAMWRDGNDQQFLDRARAPYENLSHGTD